MGRPASAVKLVPLHTLVTERQKSVLARRAGEETVSMGVILRRILSAWEAHTWDVNQGKDDAAR